MNGPEAVAAFMFFGGTFWVLRPVAAALAKRIAGEHRRPAAVEQADHDEILAELQHVRQEVSELAERMDFAERLLAKPRDGGGSPPAR
jgi:ubiquinone biosynthesis protein UbiJ